MSIIAPALVDLKNVSIKIRINVTLNIKITSGNKTKNENAS